MTKRIIPLTLFTLCAIFMQAQTPGALKVDSRFRSQRSSIICDAGDTPFGGTSNQTLFPTAQSNDVMFLCKGDSLLITHNQDWDFSGDPDLSSQAGIGYVFYQCAPTETGPQIDDVEGDMCLELTPPPTTNPNFANFWVATDNINWNGNTFFFNRDDNVNGNQSIQDFFNNGDPYQAWFAPITIDDYFGGEYELDNNGVQGGCIHANVNDAFSVVFLNEISVSNVTPNAGGNGCSATFEVFGGRSEWDSRRYSSIDVSLVANPSIKGYIEGNSFHGSTVQMVVDQPGLYEVVINDEVSCELRFQIDMGSCAPVDFTAPDDFANPGDNICLDVTVEDFTRLISLDFDIKWDNTILQFTGINGVGLNINDISIAPAMPVDSIIFLWLEPSFGVSSVSLNDGDVAFQICFTVIGTPGDVSPITFSPGSSADGVVIIGENDLRHGFQFSNGSVTIISGNLAPTVTTCSTTPMGSSGSFTLSMQGGTPPYNFIWVETANPGNNGNETITTQGGSATVNGLPPGTYDLTINDAVGGVLVLQITITNAPQLVVQTTVTDPTCPGDMDGTISISNISGGVAPLSIDWSVPGNMGAMGLTGLSPGTYTVTVTDDNGCTAPSTQGIIEVTPITIDTTITHVSCSGAGDDGAISVLAAGGTVTAPSDYNYVWDNAATGPAISNLIPGTYCVSVTDNNNCEEVFCITVNDALRPMVVSWDSVTVQCANDTNGELTVNAVDGNSPIVSYTWSVPGATGPTITGLSAGTFTVTITAMDGCTTVASETLWAPGPLVQDSIVLTPPSCPNLPNPNGEINAFISGGTKPYTFKWSTGISGVGNQVLSGLAGDSTYSLTVVDGNNCDSLIIDNIFLPDPPKITIVFSNEQMVSCNNGVPCDGSALAEASGGTAGTTMYNFNWDTGESDANVVNSTAMQLCQGWNYLEVNDGLCTTTDSVFIDAPPALTIDTDSTFGIPPSCFGGVDGGAMVKGDGGTPGYSYQWSTMNIGSNISGIAAGTYTVTITDANDCQLVFPIDVREPDLLVATIDTIITMDVSCNADTDGQIAVIPTGGTPTYNFTWSGAVSTSSTAIGLAPGTYVVTITDANGCTAENSHTISAPPPVFATIPTPQEPICFGFQTLVTIDTAWGGVGGVFTFSVDNGPLQNINAGIPVLAGQHLISVFDGNDCPFDTTITIGQPTPVIVSLGVDLDIQLGDSIEIRPNIGSALPIDSLLWSPTTDLTCLSPECDDVSVKPFSTTEYTLTVIDTNGCSGSDAIIVDVDKNRNVFIPNIFTPNEDGINDVFQVFTGAGVERINYMQVYDRWGELMYEVRDFIPDNDVNIDGWNGTFNGKKMNPAVFVYLIQVKFVDGLELLYRGDVTLLR